MIGVWVLLGIAAFCCVWFLFIRSYARRHGSDLSLRGRTGFGSRDVMYNPDLGTSQRGPDAGSHGHHHGGGFSGGGHHGGGWSGGGGDSGGGSHHH